MENLNKKFNQLGIQIPEILLPEPDVDMKKWAVVACDQFTAQPDYWKKVEDFVGDSPSTLSLILPEVYLSRPDTQQRIESINRMMHKYLQSRVLQSHGQGFIYIERKLPGIPARKGLIAALDLERYDYRQDVKPLIRPTEGTVIDRLPPRVKIRKNAPLELPHILVLIDDENKKVIEPLSNRKDDMERVYNFNLMMDGGSITGYFINNPQLLQGILDGLSKLAEPGDFRSRYSLRQQEEVLLYAVGDGNHSLAAARSHWENVKAATGDLNHPARYALVELENIHDEGIGFEPIHRVVFNIRPKALLHSLTEWLRDRGSADWNLFDTKRELDLFIKNYPAEEGSHSIEFVCSKGYGIITVQSPQHQLAVGTLQSFLDSYLKSHNSAEIDYIHGESVTAELGARSGNMGFFLPSIDKGDFFKTIVRDGVFPRKTFSMGEASGKRYYIEARKICANC